MSFTDTLSEWGLILVKAIEKLTFWVANAIEQLDKFRTVIPGVVDFIGNLVEGFTPDVIAGNITGDEAQKAVEEATLAEFHGSGPLITKPVIRQIIEQWVIVHQAKAGITTEEKDRAAIAKGYIVPEELQRARKGWPGILPVD